MKRKKIKRTVSSKSLQLTPIMQLGVVFIFVAAILLVAFVAKNYM